MQLFTDGWCSNWWEVKSIYWRNKQTINIKNSLSTFVFTLCESLIDAAQNPNLNLLGRLEDSRVRIYTQDTQCSHCCSSLYALCTKVAELWLGYGQDDRRIGVCIANGAQIFLFATTFRPALGSTQSPIQGVPGIIYLVVRRSAHEADHSPPTGAEVMKGWSYTSTKRPMFLVLSNGSHLYRMFRKGLYTFKRVHKFVQRTCTVFWNVII
jgi:hypothetical protein